MKIKKEIKNLICKEEKEKIKLLESENNKLKKEIKKLNILNKFKDDIISAISHEFKNPISIINGYIETILESNLDENTKLKFLKKIHKNTSRLNSLIDRLYLITKLENNKIKPQFRLFNLKKTAQNIIEGFEDRIILNAKDINIYADKNLIEIVLQNLISNALKYSSKEVIVNIDEEKVEIIDKGKGIDKKDLELIKEKFYRIAKNDWDNSLGLGLSIVDKILKLHHIELKIESEKNKGSNFYFYITSLKDKANLKQSKLKSKTQ